MNPLFSGPNTKRSTFYNSKGGSNTPTTKQSNVNLNTVSGRGTEPMDQGISPAPTKKPRISLEPDPFDEFPDEEFTAGDLEAMEIMASQAMSQPDNGTRQAKPSSAVDSISTTSRGVKPVKKPVTTLASSSLTTDKQGYNQQQRQSNINFITHGKIQHSNIIGKQTTKSSSVTSMTGPYSASTVSSSKFPLVQSNINIPSNAHDRVSKETKMTQESKPVSSHQSGQFMKKLGGTAGNIQTPPVGSLARDSPTLPNSQDGRVSPFLQQELERLKNECARFKKELASLHEERYKKDGEIKLLRDNLQKTTTDLNKAHMDKIQLTDEQKREQSRKEKELGIQVERLKTQLQFKEVEIVEIQSRCKKLEKRVDTSSTNITPKNSPQVSKGPVQVRPNTSPVKVKDGFPTRQSFHANNQQSTPTKSPKAKTRTKYSPRQKKGPSSPGNTSSPRRKSSGSYSLDSRQPKLPSVCKLHSSTNKGVCTSAQLVSKLLHVRECHTYSTESSTRQGLITLLQSPTILPDHHASLEKDYGTIATLKSRSPSIQSGDSWSALRIASEINHRKALQTVSQLLTESSTNTDIPSCTSHVGIPSTSTARSSVNTALVNTNCKSSHSDVATPLGLLPVIQDHLVRYIDVLHSVAEPSVVSTFSGSAASRSIDTNSTESSTSSKTQDSENWAFVQTEKATLNSLVILQRLICNSCCVRMTLLRGNPDNIMENSPAVSHPSGSHGGHRNTSVMEIDPSAPLIPDTQAVTQRPGSCTRHTTTKTSDPVPIHCKLHNIPANSILTKVLRIASIHNMYGQSTEMVQTTLLVLLCLAKNSEKTLLDRLQPLLTDGTIQNCLSPDNNCPSIVSTAIDILNYTICNKSIVLSLCNQSDSCTLLRLYHLCECGLDSLPDSEWTQIQLKILQFFTTLFSCQHNTVSLLVESDCDCSVEVVKALVLMLYKEYNVFCQSTVDNQIDSLSFQVIRQGILLLHYLCVYDRLFISHRVDVEHSYVKLISAVSALYKDLPDITEHEATVIQELWDFDQPDEVWSPEGEEDDDVPMETE